MNITPEIQKQLYAETDARFAAKTGIARKLDPKNALDQKQIPVWQHLYADVLAQFHNGTIVWTYNHPMIAPLLTQASTLSTAAATGLDAAQKATDPQAKAAAAQDAHAALTGAAAATQQAKQVQQSLIASESPVAAAVAAGMADSRLGQKIHDATQAIGAALSSQQPIIKDASDIVAAAQGAGAAVHHALGTALDVVNPSAAPAGTGGVAPSPYWKLIVRLGGVDTGHTFTNEKDARMAAGGHPDADVKLYAPDGQLAFQRGSRQTGKADVAHPFNTKAALGIGAGVAFLGAVALIASSASSPKRRRRSSVSRTAIVRYQGKRSRVARGI